MERTAVNPWEWSASMGFNQGEVVAGHARTLFCAGQTAVNADGAPQHAGDMGAQISLALDNLESVLEHGGNGARRRRAAEHLHDRRGPPLRALRRPGRTDRAPRRSRRAGTLLGVARLAYPELLVELEATAVA